jgi:hypothetical protein
MKKRFSQSSTLPAFGFLPWVIPSSKNFFDEGHNCKSAKNTRSIYIYILRVCCTPGDCHKPSFGWQRFLPGVGSFNQSALRKSAKFDCVGRPWLLLHPATPPVKN